MRGRGGGRGGGGLGVNELERWRWSWRGKKLSVSQPWWESDGCLLRLSIRHSNETLQVKYNNYRARTQKATKKDGFIVTEYEVYTAWYLTNTPGWIQRGVKNGSWQVQTRGPDVPQSGMYFYRFCIEYYLVYDKVQKQDSLRIQISTEIVILLCHC